MRSVKLLKRSGNFQITGNVLQIGTGAHHCTSRVHRCTRTAHCTANALSRGAKGQTPLSLSNIFYPLSLF